MQLDGIKCEFGGETLHKVIEVPEEAGVVNLECIKAEMAISAKRARKHILAYRDK